MAIAVTTTDSAVSPASIPYRLDGLAECIRQIQTGPWSLIQLRGEQLHTGAIDGDDIDLLGTRDQFMQLINAAASWMRQGLCHFRVRSQTDEKIELILYSIDGRHSLTFDLWVRLRQMGRGSLELTYNGCRHLVDERLGGIVRLPVDVEACIYIQHLICKRKDLGRESPQRRLLDYAEHLMSIRELALARMTRQVAEQRVVAKHIEHETLKHLRGRVTLLPSQHGVVSKIRRLWQQRLASPRDPSMICVMGCDGAGKTTLAEALSARHPTEIRVLTGKHLYRKSLLYKLSVIFLRPLVTRSRERFDDLLAPWLYLRAAISLRAKLILSRQTLTLVDRSLIDFLYIDRKTDRPRFVWKWLMSVLGCRIPTVHCNVAFDNVMNRKQEMTKAGHTAYDRDMFAAFTRRVPTDYICLNNDQPLEAAQSTLEQLIARLTSSRFELEQAASQAEDAPMPKRLAG